MVVSRRGARAALVAALVAIAIPCTAQPAQDPAAAQALRSEIDQLKQDFNARLSALVSRLSALEGAQPAGTPGAPAPAEVAAAPGNQPTAQVPAGAEGGGGPSGALPVYGNAAAGSKVFNPDMAAIGNFVGAGKQTTDRAFQRRAQVPYEQQCEGGRKQQPANRGQNTGDEAPSTRRE